MTVTPEEVYRLIDATWPPAKTELVGPFVVREGRGGGSRVSAATVLSEFGPSDLGAAERAMVRLGQCPLFMIRAHDTELDAALEDRGYAIKDPVTIYAAPIDQLTQTLPPPVTTFEVWPSLAIQRDIWASGGIGQERIAVMERAMVPHTTVLGRIDDRAAATAFVGASGELAMIHAIEVLPRFRRRGLGAHLLRAAARWAGRQGATFLCLLVTKANQPANGLYASMGMEPVGHYHYRQLRGPQND